MGRNAKMECPEVEAGIDPFLLCVVVLGLLGLVTTLYLVQDVFASTKKKKRAGRSCPSAGKKFIIGGNWKCETNCAKVKEIVTRLNGIATIPKSIEVFVCPPSPHLATVIDTLRPDIAVSSQDCGFLQKYGAFTGESFAGMLKDLECEYALVGHSERRSYQTESSELVANKAKSALDNGLGAVVCIGESKEEREKGIPTLKKVLLDDQMAALVKAIGTDPKVWNNVVIAYEPVWAIGTGLSATPEDAQETHKIIREWVATAVEPHVAANLRIQYGGSVKGNTAEQLAKQPDIDGFLVGGSSLKDDFLEIIRNAEKGMAS